MTLHRLPMMLAFATASALILPPAVKTRAAAPQMIMSGFPAFNFPWMQPGKAAVAVPTTDEAEEVCYLEEEKEFMTYRCVPYVAPHNPDWWYEYDWPAGSSQAISIAETKAAE